MVSAILLHYVIDDPLPTRGTTSKCNTLHKSPLEAEITKSLNESRVTSGKAVQFIAFVQVMTITDFLPSSTV